MRLPNRIFIVGRPHPDSFVRNVAITAEKMRVLVRTLPSLPGQAYQSRSLAFLGDIAPRLLPVWKKWLNQGIVRRIVEFKPDLVLTLTREIDNEALEEISCRTKALLVHWFADALANLGREELMSRSYHAVFLKQKEAAARLKAIFGNRFHYLPEAMNPLWHKPVEPSPRYRCDVGVAGNLYPYRCRILEQVGHYDIKIWGPPPPMWLKSSALKFYMGEYVAEHTKAVAFSSAGVSLNTLSLREGNSINCRAFEIAGCGGFQVMESRPIVSEFFEPGKEILLYSSIDELKNHIERGLKDKRLNQELRSRAASRARAEHTYEHRLRRMFKILYP